MCHLMTGNDKAVSILYIYDIYLLLDINNRCLFVPFCVISLAVDVHLSLNFTHSMLIFYKTIPSKLFREY